MDNSSSEEDNCTRGFKKPGLGLSVNRDADDNGANKFGFSLANRRSVLDDDEDEPMEEIKEPVRASKSYQQPGLKLGLAKKDRFIKALKGESSDDEEELGRCMPEEPCYDSDFGPSSSERSYNEVNKMAVDTVKSKSLVVSK